MDGVEEVRVEAAPYCCSTCDGGEVSGRSLTRRNKKTRSLSTSSAGSSSEYRRTQSLHGPSPVTTFGPKACMLQNPHAVMHIQDPASQRLTWNKPPKSVLVIKKIRDASLLEPFKELCIFLTEESVPPVMAFHLGSLGFLTPFKFDTYQSQVTQIIEGNAAIVLRSRLKVRVLKENWEKKARVDEKGIILTNGDIESSRKAMQYQVLNEVVVDRGPSSYLSNVDLFLDGHLITTVQGDGVIVSTPTGSTAYAVAAGASMIHPNVPAIMITPICPHSLSFRPIVVPAGVELKIMLSRDARNTAWVSFDGRKRQEICHGDSITITTSCFPVPSICFRDPVNDWFESLAQCLHWNVRKKQNYLSSEDEEF
ncbi:NAD kinase [Collichthys lucidus]|uniref:NAD(+) kinase n=1 Tax=Collichthys lucidus TaxID=240159 RepID=A0A4U5URW7_COLLU|nr:NAD kinase [Collichthys lucidus]